MFIFTIFVFHNICVLVSSYEIPEPSVKILKPNGFRVSIPDEKGIEAFGFTGTLNRKISQNPPVDFVAKEKNPQNGTWVFEATNIEIFDGDVLDYRIFIEHDLLGYSQPYRYEFTFRDYEVPKPRFKVLPKGFRVSIPQEEGIQLFAFHGNLNVPMNGLEAGQFSQDVVQSKRGRWIFEDRQTKLKRGDVIYYWLFVIKDHLGYRRESGVYLVKDSDITTTSSEGSQENNFHASSAQQFHLDNESDTGYKIALKVSDIAGDLYEEVKKLREINSVLTQLVKKDDELSRTLKFEGVLPEFDDAEYVAQILVNEKLRLTVPVVNATRNPDRSVSFQVASLDDKVFLIRSAKKSLVDSKIKLVY
ncbi:uncharacterized protein [Diabrotica undecimpunctata]|uniref:uncharacterized protein n=1 Tax=Diabrotica undecimpunctata TaxID=50387 RepID=UPI003B63D931